MAEPTKRLASESLHALAVRSSPELVFGLVGAIGTDLSAVATALIEALQNEAAYFAYQVRLSHLLHELEGLKTEGLTTDGDRYEYYKAHMAAGTELRTLLKAPDALARLAISAIRDRRREALSEDSPVGRRAFVLHSLKRREEVLLLRQVYGSAFFLISAYSPRDKRVDELAVRIAQSRGKWNSDEFRSSAEELVQIDERQVEEPLGQHVQEAFPEGDVFIDASDPTQMLASVRRFVRLAFGDPFLTPRREEHGMFFAKAAALRSSALGRQVGAALCTQSGELVCVGTNEVPKAGGGLYWEGDESDGRDFVFHEDRSDRHKRDLVMEVMQRLKAQGWLAEHLNNEPPASLAEKALAKTVDAPLRDSRLTNLIEFMRPVHAEMAALMDAARFGRAVQNCVAYVTTFPCHECARHLVAAGLARVVFIDPYPKSLAIDLYRDSIALEGRGDPKSHNPIPFVPFVGIAPRRYQALFELRSERKMRDGKTVSWDPAKVHPKEPAEYAYYSDKEAALLEQFEKSVEDVGLSFRSDA